MSTTANSNSIPVTEVSNHTEKKYHPRQALASVVAIFGTIIGFFRAVVSGCLSQDKAHADQRTSNMATYIFTSGWSFFIAACIFYSAPGISWGLVGSIAILQLTAAMVIAFAANRKRNLGNNDGDLG